MKASRKEKERALEALLVGAAQSGDRRAMEQLVQLTGPVVLAHAGRLLGDADGARDVAQEAWMDIARGLKRLREPRAFRAWALQIVSRKVAREIALRQRHRATEAAVSQEASVTETEASGAETGAETLDGMNDKRRLQRAIAGLSAPHRATVALFYLEDMRVAEVAAAMDVPVGTVKTRLMHARAKLRAALDATQME